MCLRVFIVCGGVCWGLPHSYYNFTAVYMRIASKIASSMKSIMRPAMVAVEMSVGEIAIKESRRMTIGIFRRGVRRNVMFVYCKLCYLVFVIGTEFHVAFDSRSVWYFISTLIVFFFSGS